MARQFAQRARMPKHWDSIGVSNVTVFSATSTAVIGGSLAQDEAWTIIRMLGEYLVGPDASTPPVAGDHVAIGVGIAVVSSDAATLGGTAVPDPVGEAQYPWLYWKVHQMHFETGDLDPSSATASVRQSFDIRSMRKVKPSESLIMVADYLNITGSPAIIFAPGITRVLIAR